MPIKNTRDLKSLSITISIHIAGTNKAYTDSRSRWASCKCIGKISVCLFHSEPHARASSAPRPLWPSSDRIDLVSAERLDLHGRRRLVHDEQRPPRALGLRVPGRGLGAPEDALPADGDRGPRALLRPPRLSALLAARPTRLELPRAHRRGRRDPAALQARRQLLLRGDPEGRRPLDEAAATLGGQELAQAPEQRRLEQWERRQAAQGPLGLGARALPRRQPVRRGDGGPAPAGRRDERPRRQGQGGRNGAPQAAQAPRRRRQQRRGRDHDRQPDEDEPRRRGGQEEAASEEAAHPGRGEGPAPGLQGRREEDDDADLGDEERDTGVLDAGLRARAAHRQDHRQHRAVAVGGDEEPGGEEGERRALGRVLAPVQGAPAAAAAPVPAGRGQALLEQDPGAPRARLNPRTTRRPIPLFV